MKNGNGFDREEFFVGWYHAERGFSREKNAERAYKAGYSAYCAWLYDEGPDSVTKAYDLWQVAS